MLQFADPLIRMSIVVQARVDAAFVVIVGVGAVGSHAAQLIARTGVRRIRLIDGAAVTERSLQSHALAVREDLGTNKVPTCQLRPCPAG